MISLATLRQLAHSTGQLLYLAFTPEARLCSRGQVTVIGQEWRHADFEVDPQEIGPHGLESIDITFTDMDFSWAWRLREEFTPGIACQWYLLDRGANGWEAEMQFSGALEAPRIGKGGVVKLGARLASGHTAWVPRVPFESPYSLARDSEIVINGTTYRVE